MQAFFCDLCNMPFKEEDLYFFYVSPPVVGNRDTVQEYAAKLGASKKEICATCKMIIDKIFELRRSRLLELTTEINQMSKFVYKPKEKDEK